MRRAAKFGFDFYRRTLRRGALARALRQQPRALLNLGSTVGGAPGWVNADVMPVRSAYYLDGEGDWPIPANSIDAILCEHMIEHVDKQGGRRLLAEAFRTLKPGAPLRIVTPDLQAFARMALDPEGEDAGRYRQFLGGRGEVTTGDVVNGIFYCYGHRYIYMADELAGALRQAGFENIVVGKPDEPVNQVFRGAERHSAHVGRDINHLEAFAVEANKPGNLEASDGIAF